MSDLVSDYEVTAANPVCHVHRSMFLFYLHQATVPGCWDCQLDLDVGFEG